MRPRIYFWRAPTVRFTQPRRRDATASPTPEPLIPFFGDGETVPTPNAPGQGHEFEIRRHFRKSARRAADHTRAWDRRAAGRDPAPRHGSVHQWCGGLFRRADRAVRL